MSQVVSDISVSVDGYAAGPNQTAEKPFGDGPVETCTPGCSNPGGERGGGCRNYRRRSVHHWPHMFAPGRAEWDLDWAGWWGEDPPYHAPVFVLIHHPRDPLVMGRHDVRLRHRTDFGCPGAGAGGGGGQGRGDRRRRSDRNQFLAAGSVDELRLHIAP